MKKLFFRQKMVGELREDGVFITKRSPEHFFRKYNGFGCSYDLLVNIKKQGCNRIVILYERGEQTSKLEVKINKFFEEGFVYRDGELDFQRILPLSAFNQKSLERFLQ